MSRFTEKEYQMLLMDRGFSKDQAAAMAQGGQQVSNAPINRKNKYGAKPVRDEAGKQLYASRKEARRGAELELLERQGLITGLKKQPKYAFRATETMAETLVYDSGRVVQYWGDFEYYDDGGELVIEDVKGVRTPVFRLKKALMWAYHRIEVVEV